MKKKFVLNNWYIFLLIALLSSSCEKEELSNITIETKTVTESNSNQTISLKISLSEPAKANVTFTVSTRERTALAGDDFIEFRNLAGEIPAGMSETMVDIEIIGDNIFEEDEIFFVLLEDVINATPTVEIVQIDILNDDTDPNTTLQGPSSPEQYVGMNLIWRDEFNSNLDGNNWTQEFGDNWYNNELQTYTDQDRNVWTQSGNLIIEAREEASPYGGNNPYTSGRIITQDKFEFKYGRVDIRAAMPEGQGIWPALWTLGADIDVVNWPSCGEIDILEMIGGGTENVANNAMHWQGDTEKEQEEGSYTLPTGSLHGEYHVYSIIWDSNSVTYLIDDIVRDIIDIQASDMTEFHAPHFLIMNVAVGGDWPGNPDATTSFPQRMVVDYVRVFQDQ